MYPAQFIGTLRLDPALPIPLFRQLYEAIKQAVLSGAIGPGMQLLPTREFATLLGISRQTVLNAYAQLMAEGYLAGAVGKGTYVSRQLALPAKLAESVTAEQQALRPLSNRGQYFADACIRLNTDIGMPRAFRVGMPGLDVFPFDVWARLEARRWRRPTAHLGYADPAGHFPLRELLALYLHASRGVQCDPAQIIITSGSQQALYLIATLLLAPQDAAWVEDPCYQGTSAMLHAVQARICPVPLDKEGLRVAFGAKHYPEAKLAFVTPSHQYPLGVTMSLQRRLDLLAWAAAHKTWVVEDDYDSEYRYTGPPLASLQSLDKSGCVIYVGTLSKVLFPGLRLGYLVVPPSLVDAFTRGKAVLDRQTPIISQLVLSDFISEGHFNRHIKHTREMYAERRATLLQALETQLDDEIYIGSADAGLHLTIAFRRAQNDQQVAQAALERGIGVRALSQYYFSGHGAVARETVSSGLLLGFAPVPVTEIKPGVAVLREAIKGRM
jgi:GntR family transcriptional regulator/MocR family aminotransferase